MAKLKAKLKQKLKPTYEKAEVKPLAEKELNKLSREVILEMYRKQRFGKIKALQQEITDRTMDEKGDFRDMIVENARTRLNKLEKEKKLRFSKEGQLKKAKEFAAAIIGIDDEDGSLLKVLKHQQHKQREFEMFVKMLDNNVGREQKSRRLKKLIKNNVWAAKLIALIQQKNPKAMDEINVAINQGDYDELKKALIKGDDSISKKQVDYIFAAAMTQTTGMKEYTGNKTVDGLINNVVKLRYIGHTYSMKKASEDAGVSFWLVMRLGQTTLASLRTMDAKFQMHKALIEDRKKLTKKDQERLTFIEAVHKMRKTYDKKVDGKGLKGIFTSALDKHLDAKFNDPKFNKKIGDVDKQRLRAEIIARAEMKDMKLFQIFDLTYGSEKERSRLLFHGFSRSAALGYQFYRNLALEEDKHLRTALKDYWLQRGSNREIWQFRKNAKKWGMNELVKDLDNLEARAKAKGAPLTDLAEDAKKYKINSNNKRINVQELYDRDMIVKKFHILSQRATVVMSRKAKSVVDAGKVLDTIRADKGDKFMKTLVSDMNIDKRELEAIYGKGKVPSRSSITGKKLVGKYGNKLADLKTMQDVTQARFSGLAQSIESNVENSFSSKMQGQLKDIDETKFRNRVDSKLDNIATTSRVKKYGKKLIIPSIIVGIQAGRLWTGNAKTGEVFWDLTEAGLGFVPVVGTALDFKAAIQGQSLSGKKLGAKERAVSFGFGCVGIVADALTVLGGAGMALRATVGGMRGTRRALQAGKNMGKLSDAGHIADLGPLSKIGGWFGGKFNKASRLENATKSTIKAKATEQARHLSDLHHELKGLDGFENGIDASKPLNSEIARIEGSLDNMVDGARKTRIQNKLTQLKKMQKRMKGENASYLTAFNKAASKEMKIIKRSDYWIVRKFQSAGMFTLEGLRKAKAGLSRIGVSKTAVLEYEKSFEKIQTLRKIRADQMDNIARITKNKDIAEKDFRALEALKDSGRLSPEKNKLIEQFAKERKLLAKKRKLKIDHEKLLRKKKVLDVADKKLSKAEYPVYLYSQMKGSFIHKMSIAKFTELAKQGTLTKHVKGTRAKFDALDLQKAYKKPGSLTKFQVKQKASQINDLALKKSNDALKKNADSIIDNKAKITKYDNKVAKADQKWRDDANKAQDTIKSSESNIAKAQKELGGTNTKLAKTAAQQFEIHSQMALKAERFTQRMDNMRRLSKYMQYGGMAMGAIWFFGDVSPGKQLEVVGKTAKVGVKAVGKVAHELYIADHSGRSSIDKYIDDKIHVLVQKKKMAGIIAAAKADGKSEEEILAANMNTAGAQEIIRQRGWGAKMSAYIAKHGEGAHKREIVTGDAARKLRETNG